MSGIERSGEFVDAYIGHIGGDPGDVARLSVWDDLNWPIPSLLRLTYNDRDCAFRVTLYPIDKPGHEPVSGGGPDLPTALRNLAWVLEAGP